MKIYQYILNYFRYIRSYIEPWSIEANKEEERDRESWKLTYMYYIYITGEMDISAGSVLADHNLTGEMEPRMNTNI